MIFGAIQLFLDLSVVGSCEFLMDSPSWPSWTENYNLIIRMNWAIRHYQKSNFFLVSVLSTAKFQFS